MPWAGGRRGRAGGRRERIVPAATSARPPRSDTRRRLVNETTQLYLFNDHYLIGKKLPSVTSLSPQGLCQVYPTWGVRRLTNTKSPRSSRLLALKLRNWKLVSLGSRLCFKSSLHSRGWLVELSWDTVTFDQQHVSYSHVIRQWTTIIQVKIVLLQCSTHLQNISKHCV